MLELREVYMPTIVEEPVKELLQEITATPALELHPIVSSKLSQEEPVFLDVPGATGSLAASELVIPAAETTASKPELAEEPQQPFATREQLPYFRLPEPTAGAVSLEIEDAALLSAARVVEEKVREAVAEAEREAKKVDEEKEAVSAAVPTPAIQVAESVSEIPGESPLTQPFDQLVTAVSGGIRDMRAEAPGVTESELAIADALRASEEEARSRESRAQGILAEAIRPQIEQQEAEAVTLESLVRPLVCEREMDQAQISDTVLPPSDTKPYAEFQESLKASSSTNIPSAAAVTMASRRLTPDYAVSAPAAVRLEECTEKGATEMEQALQQPLIEKDENEIRELAAAAVVVAAASAAVNAQQQREMAAFRQPSITGSMITAASEAEVSQKIAGDMNVLPSASRTALVAVLTAEPLQKADIQNAIAASPSTVSSSVSVEDVGRIRRGSSRDQSEDLRVPEPVVPVLDDEIQLPRPTSFNVPVINIQYNFHFPPPGGAPGSPGRQTPPSPEQAMAARVLQGALAQQGMAGHIPGRHVLSPEQEALRQMTDRLNYVAQHGEEPYTGRQSPGRGTMFRQLPRKPVPLVPPLQPPGGDMEAQERKRHYWFRFIVCFIAFLMVVFILLYCLGLIGNKRYFMYYS
ncbi:hypothetical protein HPB50_002477 [Hyalomma asiaticum]|uniref:Uncharacterized protein n=1 Tax=Hyalomma asiaticum TaxID=266040 RepID=A0ACB7RGZ5_HYAAI|nr:hypothetical protein HPB50_002477 [Hyalomma asiaticum]